jgi:hypothetical protein
MQRAGNAGPLSTGRSPAGSRPASRYLDGSTGVASAGFESLGIGVVFFRIWSD